MPVVVPKGLPALKNLRAENIFVMDDQRAAQQDIRPLRIAIINLMPTLAVTETQLVRVLSNTSLQVDLQLLKMDTHNQRPNDLEHLALFYKSYDEIANQKFDGMIITGAPVETLPYDEVDYWEELKQIMDLTRKNVFSTIHICWAAQAALFHHYGVQKHMLNQKLFGVYPHRLKKYKSDLIRGFDDVFYVPHSRHSQIYNEDLAGIDELRILADSQLAGPHIIATKNQRWIFLQGHGEYDRETLNLEYQRDVELGKSIGVPYNYFIDDDPKKGIRVTWKGHGNLFFSNWLDFVYQNTPYDLNKLETMKW